MDGSRFDSLTQDLVRRSSRRGAAKAFAGAALATLVGLVRPGDAAAADLGQECQSDSQCYGRPGLRCRGPNPGERVRRCLCPDNHVLCAPYEQGCIDVGTNLSHCGGCGNQCNTGQICAGGRCVSPNRDLGDRCDTNEQCIGRPGLLCRGIPPNTFCLCPNDHVLCSPESAGCIDVKTDPANCGGCGRRCANNQNCSGGRCLCRDGRPPCGGTCCTQGRECCRNRCVLP
jgi:hypothetical protein